MPKLSFVIPTHNSVTWLPHAVKSCQSQTIGDIEIVIVDDGSTDRTQQYLKWLKDNEPRAVIHTFERNVGRCTARNKGNELAKSDIICVLDADDIAYPNRAKLTLDKIKGADFIYGSAEVMDALGKKLGVINADVFNRSRSIETLENRIVHSTCAYKKKIAEDFPYESIHDDISKLGIDDWHMQIRVLLSKKKTDFIISPICGYRILESGISSQRDHAQVNKVKFDLLKNILADKEVVLK